jgi:hypothetical protein
MLQQFFHLNSCDSLKRIESAEEFVWHFQNSRSLQNSLVVDKVTVIEKGFKDHCCPVKSGAPVFNVMILTAVLAI